MILKKQKKKGFWYFILTLNWTIIFLIYCKNKTKTATKTIIISSFSYVFLDNHKFNQKQKMHKNQSYQLKCDIDSSQYHKFNWITYLKETNSEAAPLDHFPTAPAYEYEYAKNIKPNIAVEILNPEKTNSFWSQST